MTMYQIKPLPLETLVALQRAILQGAFAQPIALMRAQIEANRDNSHLIDSLMEDIGNLQHAAQAIMDAGPENQGPANLVRTVQEMRPGGVLDKSEHFRDSASKLAFILDQAERVRLN